MRCSKCGGRPRPQAYAWGEDGRMDELYVTFECPTCKTEWEETFVRDKSDNLNDR